ncbi:MAG: hypothetical protein ACRDTX_18755 [Pseudonocardiaceae bacterium]
MGRAARWPGSCRAANVGAEDVGVAVGNEHPQAGHSVRVQHPTAPLPVSDGDHGADPAAVDATAFHSAPFLLTLRQVVRPVHFLQLRHCPLPSRSLRARRHPPSLFAVVGLVDTQDRAFGLLEGRQRPEQTRDLYLIAGIACGLMAKASHDLGVPHDALTQARTGYACADNSGHDGLRAWIRGLQALITYWSGRLEDSVRYAQLGGRRRNPQQRHRQCVAGQ